MLSSIYVVYTSDDPTTTTADKAQWKTDPTKVTGAVRRVGFVNDPNIITSVAPGQTVTGFTIQVKTQGLTAPVTIANIAQTFGTTSGDPNKALIYDDSGDQNPNNIDPKTGNPTHPNPDSGYILDPTKLTPTNEDTGNNNTGPTAGGDPNVFTISSPQANAVLNGPNGAPDAVGPTNTNDDFTNKSALIPPNTAPNSTVNPASVPFTNTVENNGTSMNNISLLPIAPTTQSDLPSGSTVTITYGSASATYTYNGTAFTSSQSPIQIANLAPGAKANYGVEVKLPTTKLSTDTGKGFPVPITAFIDTNNNGVIDPTEVLTENTTIDRVYTGFVKLLKESRVVQGTGPAVQTGQDTFSATPKNPAPGNIIVRPPTRHRIRANRSFNSLAATVLIASVMQSSMSAFAQVQNVPISITNQASYTYTDLASKFNFQGSTSQIQAVPSPLTDPLGRILGCSGELLPDWRYFYERNNCRYS